MNRKTLWITGGIILSLIVYLGLSYSLFVDAVDANEKHIIKQSRVALREISNRMATFLSDQSESLKMLALFHEVRKEISINSFKFMEEISFMELTSSNIFVVFDDKGDCVMTTPVKYSNLLKNKNFSQEKFFLSVKEKEKTFISKAIPVRGLKPGKDLFFIFAFTPIYKPDNSFGGVIGIGFEVKSLFHKYFKPLETDYEGSVACVTDENGNIEVFKEDKVIKKNSSDVKPSVLPPIPQNLVKEGYHGSYLWDRPDEEKYLIIYHPIYVDENVWVAQLKIPYAAIDRSLSPFYWKLFISLIILILIASGGIAIAVMTGRQIRQLKSQIDELQIQIDYEKKKIDVDRIVSSDYFQDLVQQAEVLKKE